jgi:hypothetical protein
VLSLALIAVAGAVAGVVLFKIATAALGTFLAQLGAAASAASMAVALMGMVVLAMALLLAATTPTMLWPFHPVPRLAAAGLMALAGW